MTDASNNRPKITPIISFESSAEVGDALSCALRTNSQRVSSTHLTPTAVHLNMSDLLKFM